MASFRCRTNFHKAYRAGVPHRILGGSRERCRPPSQTRCGVARTTKNSFQESSTIQKPAPLPVSARFLFSAASESHHARLTSRLRNAVQSEDRVGQLVVFHLEVVDDGPANQGVSSAAFPAPLQPAFCRVGERRARQVLEIAGLQCSDTTGQRDRARPSLVASDAQRNFCADCQDP